MNGASGDTPCTGWGADGGARAGGLVALVFG